MTSNAGFYSERVPERQDSRGSFRHDLLVGLFSGLAVAFLSVLVQVQFDDVRSDREARQENLRYVRDRSSDQLLDRPFQGIDLRGANLNGLKLEKADLGAATLVEASANQANLKSAGLSKAKLRNSLLVKTDFSDAILVGADVSHAKLIAANLQRAHLQLVDFDGAELVLANVRGTDLSLSRNLDKAVLTNGSDTICYDELTKWPKEFTPPMVGSTCDKNWVPNA